MYTFHGRNNLGHQSAEQHETLISKFHTSKFRFEQASARRCEVARSYSHTFVQLAVRHLYWSVFHLLLSNCLKTTVQNYLHA